MREKRRKIPLEVILATPVSEYRKRHGKQVFAARLCKQGKLEQAQSYCAKNGLPFPPFSDKTLGTPSVVAPCVEPSPLETVTGGSALAALGATADPLSDGAREAGPVAREEATPQEVATGDIAPSEPISGASHATRGEPEGGVRKGQEPHETATPVVPRRKAKVWAFCINPKLIRVKFVDGEREFGSMWATRGGFRLNDIITVERERGEGANAIWEEVKGRA
jgi:hypothetical protein